MTAPPTPETAASSPPRVTNQELGEAIGLSHSSVSRLRSGERGTSTTVMLRIEAEFGWNLHDQLKRRDDGSYAAELERRLADWKTRRLAGSGRK